MLATSAGVGCGNFLILIDFSGLLLMKVCSRAICLVRGRAGSLYSYKIYSE
jgi:hypothetical protein